MESQAESQPRNPEFKYNHENFPLCYTVFNMRVTCFHLLKLIPARFFFFFPKS